MDLLAGLSQGFGIALAPWNLVHALLGAGIGTAIGVLPGLGAPATIALLLPATYRMDPTSAVIMLAGIFYGAMYGGSTTSILLKIPGEAASMVTCLDGYALARQGRAGPALGMSALGSFIAGSLSVLAMSLIAPSLATFALQFGPAEYASLVLLGLIMAVYLAERSVVKGLLMVALGVVLGTVGIDPVFGAARFTFGVPRLMDGLDFVVAGMGLFGIAEVLVNLEARDVRQVYKASLRGLLPSPDDWRRCWPAILRGTGLGFFIGVLPGGGAIISSLVAYAVEKRVSANPARFGHGAIEGVAAPEAANNAASSSSFIPLLTLGIPGNASIAMIFVALMVHGVQPGPLLFQEHPELFWGVIASMYVGNLMLLALNLPLIGFWVRLLRVPYHYLATVVVIICIIGAYSINNAAFDVAAMIGFGAFGYLLRKGGYPAAPLVLAMILGRILERSFLRSLQLSAGDLAIFVEKPISAALGCLIGAVILTPAVRSLWSRYRAAQHG
ncbi:MAG: tripartite tricarboxylate transporter permease [Candidatus Rokuibacteriota bacterium]